MGVTLRQILDLEVLRRAGVRVVAGADQLDRPVRWVHIAEIADIAQLINGGELLLTTGMQLEDPESQRSFVARLCDHQLAGLGFGTGFAHPEVPAAVLDVTNRRGAMHHPIATVSWELVAF